jgi:hypothetical protein
MTDRKLTVKQRGPVFELEGVAYVADKPNVNGTIYPDAVLKVAFDEFMAKPLRPVVVGCQGGERPGDVIGQVESVTYEDGVVKVLAVTMDSPAVLARVAALVSVGKVAELAFAGTCEGMVGPDERTVERMSIKSLGVVPLRDVEPQESSDT